MHCYIANSNKKIYVKISESGRVETCSKSLAQPFEISKAKNILKNLPRTMKKFHFKMEYINEAEEAHHVLEDTNKKIMVSDSYMIPDSIKIWVDKVKSCNGIIEEAKERRNELNIAQSNIDKELTNILHKIELEKWKNGCEGYKEYKEVKLVLEKGG